MSRDREGQRASLADTLLDDPSRCTIFSRNLAVHWFASDEVGAPCHCGAVKREPDADEAAPPTCTHGAEGSET